MKKNKKETKKEWCYWCDTKRLLKNLKRIELAGPARQRVYECRYKCKGEK